MTGAHLTAAQITAWRDRTLPGPERLAALAHAGACEACRALLSAPAAEEALLRAAVLGDASAAAEHPGEEALSGYLARTLDPFDRELVETHLAECPECAAEMADLRAFRAEASTYPAAVHAASTPQPWWARLTEHRPARLFLTLGLPAGAAAAAVVAVLLLQGGGASLRDGAGTVRLARNGAVLGLDVPAETRAEVAAALRGTLAPPATLADLQAPADAAGVPAFRTTGPAGTVVVEARPTFTWELPEGAVACRVRFAGAAGEKLLETKPLTEERWQPKKALVPGQVYHWQVVAVAADGREVARFPSRPDVARFRVLAADRAAALARDRAALAGSHLALGVRYVREGLLDDAEREFSALRAANPNSPLAARLQAALSALRVPTGSLA